MSDRYRKKTKEGTFTIYDTQFQEAFHSSTGSVTESSHVYIKNGIGHDHLRDLIQNSSHISILEVGFGSGLNLLLTYLFSLKKKLRVTYETIEPYPLEWTEVCELGFENFLSLDREGREFFKESHLCEWNVGHQMTPTFHFLKRKTPLEKTKLPISRYHLIYFDAFSPSVQPELWTIDIFEKIHQSMCPKKSIFVTYSSRGSVKQNLRSAGFEVSRLKGAPPKRHMVQALPLQNRDQKSR